MQNWLTRSQKLSSGSCVQAAYGRHGCSLRGCPLGTRGLTQLSVNFHLPRPSSAGKTQMYCVYQQDRSLRPILRLWDFPTRQTPAGCVRQGLRGWMARRLEEIAPETRHLIMTEAALADCDLHNVLPAKVVLVCLWDLLFVAAADCGDAGFVPLEARSVLPQGYGAAGEPGRRHGHRRLAAGAWPRTI
jgi:hypothetical protein